MGVCASTMPDGSFTSKEIDAQLDRDEYNKRDISKLLFLGSGESGKSTFFRQMQICHGQGFTIEELKSFTPVVFSNTITCMRTLVTQCPNYPDCDINQRAQSSADFLRALDEESAISDEVAEAIEILWNDPGIQKVWLLRAKFQVFDSALYFFDNVRKFANPEYVPSCDDMLRCRIRSTGIIEETFEIEGAVFKVFDVGGQRNERKKWIHCFENVTAVVFVASISEFDQLVIEDGVTNRLIESLEVFEEVVKNKWFTETSLILFLNKKDLLEEKLKLTQFCHSFPEYKGNNSYESCSEYIRQMFLSTVTNPNKFIYTHFTCATDESKILRQLFISLKTIVVEASLQAGGLMM
uniref:GPA1 n=1 Tax=Hirondellea gigas TaxID=1518452 RepID=A0A6A7G6L3_9CRUS